jgi:serine protease
MMFLMWLQGKRRLYPALAWLTIVAASCQGVGQTSSSGQLRASGVPPRSDHGKVVAQATDLLWRALSDSSPDITPGTSDQHKSSAVTVAVGLRDPTLPRGVWRASLLLNGAERGMAESSIRQIRGVHVIDRDNDVPAIALKVDNMASLDALQRSPYLDYLEPLHIDIEQASTPPGCSTALYAGPVTRDPSSGSIIPWNFRLMGVDKAWQRSALAGRGMTIAIVDVGLEPTQTLLQMPAFATGLSINRLVENLGSNNFWPFQPPDNPWATCNHGTRVAGLAAAPRNGASTVGVAWGANLITMKTHDNGEEIWGNNAFWIARGIQIARHDGARIINMAFGTLPAFAFLDYNFNYLSDVIKFEYYRTDLPSVIFVGAAGTFVGGCAVFPGGVVFPANLPEVLAVAGVDRDRRSTANSWSCEGPQVAVAAEVDAGVETTGVGINDVVTVGGSSGATAMVSGILALIWAEHPNATREEVVTRLFQSADFWSHNTGSIGWGVVDAYKAIGGFGSLAIGVVGSIEPFSRVSLQARPVGDGPFSYQWSNGSSAPTVTVVLGASGTTFTINVTVLDLRDGTTRNATVTLRTPRLLPAPCDYPQSRRQRC